MPLTTKTLDPLTTRQYKTLEGLRWAHYRILTQL